MINQKYYNNSLFSGKTRQEIVLSFLEYQYNAEQERKNNAQVLTDLYKGDQLNALLGNLKTQYPNNSFVMELQPEWYNVISIAIEENAKVFDGKLKFMINDANGQAIFDEFVKANTFQEFLRELNRHTKLLKTVLLRPCWDDEYKQIIPLVYLPQIVDVIQSQTNPQRADAVIYQKTFGNNIESEILYYYWSKSEHFCFDKDGNIIPIPDNPSGVNPYGELPFVKMFDGISFNEFFNELPLDLMNQQENINIKLTELNLDIKFQSFKPVVIKNYEGRSDDIRLSPYEPIFLPPNVASSGDPDAKTLDISGENIINFFTVIDQKIERFLMKYNVPPSRIKSRSHISSGVQLWLEDRLLITERQRQIPIYEQFLQQFWHLFKIVWNIHAPNKINPDAELLIVFGSDGDYLTPEEKNKHRQFNIEMGINSPIDYILEDRIDLNNDKKLAEEIFIENLKRRADIKSAEQGLFYSEEEKQAQNINSDEEDLNNATGGTESGEFTESDTEVV